MFVNEYIEDAIKQEREIKDMLKDLGESEEITKYITLLYYKPMQSLKRRYEILKEAQREHMYDIFIRILKILSTKLLAYYVKDNPDDYEACVYYGSYAYDFEFTLKLAKFYKRNPMLIEGHFDIIQRMCEPEGWNKPSWEKIKEFWSKYTLER